jgi:hypothetical protein
MQPSENPKASPPRSDLANSLQPPDLQPALAQAVAFWQATGLTAAEQASLAAVDVRVVNLPDNLLGWTLADNSQIWIDADAAGYGWIAGREQRADGGEPTTSGGRRAESREQDGYFNGSVSRLSYTGASSGSGLSILGPQPSSSGSRLSTPAPRPGMDVLTVLAHELGHVLGREHSVGGEHNLMSPDLSAGSRYLPDAERNGLEVLSPGNSRSTVERAWSDPFGLFDFDTRDDTLGVLSAFVVHRDESLAKLPARSGPTADRQSLHRLWRDRPDEEITRDANLLPHADRADSSTRDASLEMWESAALPKKLDYRPESVDGVFAEIGSR